MFAHKIPRDEYTYCAAMNVSLSFPPVLARGPLSGACLVTSSFCESPAPSFPRRPAKTHTPHACPKLSATMRRFRLV